jgi:short-subunit dehydrogenase
MRRFDDKVVVITGGSAGIGRAAAEQFVAEGARVVLAARGRQALEEAVAELGAERALAVPTDVADDTAASALLASAAERFGAIHVLVNNAGFNARGRVEAREVGELVKVVDVNLRAPIRLCRLALPHLRQAGGGAIVNVASVAGMVPLEDEATYSASKFGLRAFTLALAEELRGSGVTASVVSPGPVDTGFIDSPEVPDVVFSQPMSSADQVAALVLDCAADGRPERVVPARSGRLATFAYLLPASRRLLKPLLERKGRAARRRYLAARADRRGS